MALVVQGDVVARPFWQEISQRHLRFGLDPSSTRLQIRLQHFSFHLAWAFSNKDSGKTGFGMELYDFR